MAQDRTDKGELASPPRTQRGGPNSHSDAPSRAPSPVGSKKEPGGRASTIDSHAPSLALPKGGGAIRGIGEKFNFNAVTGTGSWSVPVFTSPCRGDAHPQLSVQYNSGSGNGPFGLGWDLGVASVSRRTSKHIPTYDDRDVFVLSGAEDLVPVLDSSVSPFDFTENAGESNAVQYTVMRFLPRTEGLFARIERWARKSDGDVHWRVRDKHNTLNIYGKDPNARIADPDAPSRVFRWLIESTADERGNQIVYSYKAEDAVGVDKSKVYESNRHKSTTAWTAQRYLKHIRYGNKSTNPSPTTDDDWSFQVVFDYGEHSADTPAETSGWSARVDAFSAHRSGFEVRTYRRCERVLMFHRISALAHTTGSSSTPIPILVRSTKFNYDDGHPFSHLASAVQSGWKGNPTDGYTTQPLPPLAFSYAPFDLSHSVNRLKIEDAPNLPAGLLEPGYKWLDLDGEGISGVMTEVAGAWLYQRNRGQGKFSTAKMVAQRPSMANLAGGQQQVMDLGGDGRAYLVSYQGQTPGWQAREDESWTPFRPFKDLPNLNWNDPNLKFMDLDGDGFGAY